jgi:hypothetical protein
MYHSRALGATPDPKVAVETLDYAMKNARDQDFSAYFGTIGGNIKTRRVAGDYFKEHYDSVCLEEAYMYGDPVLKCHLDLQKV